MVIRVTLTCTSCDSPAHLLDPTDDPDMDMFKCSNCMKEFRRKEHHDQQHKAKKVIRGS